MIRRHDRETDAAYIARLEERERELIDALKPFLAFASMYRDQREFDDEPEPEPAFRLSDVERALDVVINSKLLNSAKTSGR